MVPKIHAERQARALADVPKDKRPEVLKEAEKSGKLTARSITEAAEKTKDRDVIPKDKEGYPIPTPAMAIWNRRDEVKDKLRSLYELRQWATDMQGTTDILFVEVTFTTLKLDIEAVIRTLKGAVPYAVCTLCQGQAPQTCTFCKGRGMISKFRYNSFTPQEMKSMRAKLAKAR
jgi:hypothetical protein